MKSFDRLYRDWKVKTVGKLFEYLKQGAGRRTLQLTILQNGKFEAVVIEAGNIIAKATSTMGDGALVSVAISVMNLTEKPFSQRMAESGGIENA